MTQCLNIVIKKTVKLSIPNLGWENIKMSKIKPLVSSNKQSIWKQFSSGFQHLKKEGFLTFTLLD
jgi:hypothetical protein